MIVYVANLAFAGMIVTSGISLLPRQEPFYHYTGWFLVGFGLWILATAIVGSERVTPKKDEEERRGR